MCKIREYVHIHINICNYKPYDIIHTYAHGECICHAARSSRDAIAMERPRRSTANGKWPLQPRTCIMLKFHWLAEGLTKHNWAMRKQLVLSIDSTSFELCAHMSELTPSATTAPDLAPTGRTKALRPCCEGKIF